MLNYFIKQTWKIRDRSHDLKKYWGCEFSTQKNMSDPPVLSCWHCSYPVFTTALHVHAKKHRDSSDAKLYIITCCMHMWSTTMTRGCVAMLTYKQTTTFWKRWWRSIHNMSCFWFILCDSTLKRNNIERRLLNMYYVIIHTILYFYNAKLTIHVHVDTVCHGLNLLL